MPPECGRYLAGGYACSWSAKSTGMRLERPGTRNSIRLLPTCTSRNRRLRVMMLSFVGRMRRDLVRPQSAGVFPWAAWLVASVVGASVLSACADPQNSEQFQRQVKRAHECREMQDKLVGKQALIAERVDEITKIMDEAGCTAHLQPH